jgi:hypothetical protein
MNITYRITVSFPIVENGYPIDLVKPPTDNILKMVSEISKC